MNASEENLKKIHFHLLKKFKSYCWISGGAIADAFDGRTPRDVDIYFSSEQGRDNAIETLKSEGAKIMQVYPMGTKLRYQNMEIDLTCAGKTPQDVFDKFDYTVTCGAIDKKGKFFAHPEYFEHLGEKKLCYLGNAPTKGAAHYTNKIKRLKKHLKKGFTIDEEELVTWLEGILKSSKKPKKNTQGKPSSLV